MKRSPFARLWIYFPQAITFGCYAFVSMLAHTLLYTIVSYMVSVSQKTGTDFSNTVNEIAGQYLALSLALGALLLAVTIHLADKALYRHVAFWNEPQKPAWQLDRARKEELLRGLSSGLLAGLVFLVFFSISGQIAYLGVYITSTFGTPIFPLFFMDLAAIVCLLVCEEFLFRHKILRPLLATMPASAAIALTTSLHLLARHWQFQLEPLDYLNLACLNLVLGYFYLKSGKIHRGLGFLLALLLTLHNLGGLPLWGTESPSFFLFKAGTRAPALVTGGSSGPLGGLGVFGLLAIFALGSFLTWKRELEAKRQQELRNRI